MGRKRRKREDRAARVNPYVTMTVDELACMLDGKAAETDEALAYGRSMPHLSEVRGDGARAEWCRERAEIIALADDWSDFAAAYQTKAERDAEARVRAMDADGLDETCRRALTAIVEARATGKDRAEPDHARGIRIEVALLEFRAVEAERLRRACEPTFAGHSYTCKGCERLCRKLMEAHATSWRPGNASAL